MITNFQNLTVGALLTTALSFGEIVTTHTAEIDSLVQIPLSHPIETLVFYDIDDTLIDSKGMVGSQAWRRYIVKAMEKIDTSRNWHDIFSYELAKRYPVAPVENITLSFVAEMQQKGYVVCGLTARERTKWYDMETQGVDQVTSKQLTDAKIYLNSGELEKSYFDLSQDSEYFEGIFFADTELKGEYLERLFSQTKKLPKKVIFVDDKAKHVESVAKVLTKLGIPHECYTYLAINQKAKQFNPLIANIELYHFYLSGQIISDEEAAEVAKANPDRNAESYLKEIVGIAKLGF